MLKVDLVIFCSRRYASRRLSDVFPSVKRLVFSRQGLSTRIACYKGRPACFTIVQGGTLFWSSSTAAEKDFAWIMVITGTEILCSNKGLIYDLKVLLQWDLCCLARDNFSALKELIGRM
jgi:hypothetical protein